MKKAASNSVNAGNPTHAPTSENAGQTAASDANITSKEKAVKSVTAAEAERGRLEITAGNDKMRLYVQESRRGGYMAAAAQEGAAPVIFEGETREDAARQAVEYAKGEQSGGQGTRAGGERTLGLGAEGSAEGLAGEAGSDQSGTEQGRRIEKINALGLQQDSAAAQGVKNGTDTVKNRFFRPGDSEAVDKLIREDAEYSTVAALCKARGQNLILFTGLLEVNESGKIILADGMQQGSDIYIRADGNEHSPLKIYEHEDTHDAIEAAGGERGQLYQSMKARLIRNLGGEQQFEALKAKYAEALPDGYSEYDIVQEMLSDARGTMNDFRGNTQLKAALDEEVQQQIGERRTGTRGSGNNLSELGTDEDTESRRKQENFADMKQAVREVLQELGIGTQETQNAGDIAEYIRNGKKPDTIHLSSNGLDTDTEGELTSFTMHDGEETYEVLVNKDGTYKVIRLVDGKTAEKGTNIYILAQQISELSGMDPVIELDGTEVEENSNKASKNILTYFDKIGRKVQREGFGTVLLGRTGAKGSTADPHVPSKAKVKTIAAVPAVIKRGKMLDLGIHKEEIHSYMFCAKIKLMGKTVYEGAVVHRNLLNNNGDSSYYLNELLDAEGFTFTIAPIEVTAVEKTEETSGSKTRPTGNPADTGLPKISSEEMVTQDHGDVKGGNMSRINVDTDTETVAGTEIQRTQEQGRTSREPLQDTGITDNRFTEALKKIGVNNITGSLVDYAGIEVEQQMARTAAEARRYLRRVLRETRADPRTQAFAHDVARGIYTIIKGLRMLLPYFVEFAKKTGLLTLVCF